MILVTGASGKTGRAMLAALQAHGAAARALVRTPQQVPASEVIVGDLANSSTMAAALQGVDALYLIMPNMHAHEAELGAAWVTTAKAAGVRRVVYHSVLFPQIEVMPHHWQKLRVEEALIQSGLDFTVLQPASYMQNILPYLPAMLARREYRVPYAVDAPFSPVDLEDVAAAATRALLEPGHSGAVYQLAGPEVLTSADMAAQVAAHIRQPVVAVQQPLEEWRNANSQLPTYTRDTLAAMFAYYAAHGFAASSSTLAVLLKRAPSSFADFITREIK